MMECQGIRNQEIPLQRTWPGCGFLDDGGFQVCEDGLLIKL
jgi:hypothetical protein